MEVAHRENLIDKLSMYGAYQELPDCLSEPG